MPPVQLPFSLAGKQGVFCFVFFTLKGPGTRGGGQTKTKLSFNQPRGGVRHQELCVFVSDALGHLSSDRIGVMSLNGFVPVFQYVFAPSGRRRSGGGGGGGFAAGGYYSGSSGRWEECMCALLSVYS